MKLLRASNPIYTDLSLSLYKKKSLPWTSFGKDGALPVLHLDRTPIQNWSTNK
jgi:hypothetical protein